METPGARPKVLVIEDDADVRLVIERMLESGSYEVISVVEGREGLARAQAERPALVLLDVMLPDLSGWDVCRALKSDAGTASIPVVVLTAKSELKDLIAGMQVGADDYVTKPFSRKRLLETVKHHVEAAVQRPRTLATEIVDAPRVRGLLTDALTGLPTIPLLIDDVRERLLVGRELGVLFVDIIRHAELEAAHGWEVSDAILREVAEALRERIRSAFTPGDLLAISRPQSAEFYVFLAIPEGDGEALDRLQRRAVDLEEWLTARLGRRFEDQIRQSLGFFVGYGRMRFDPQIRVERLLYRAMREASILASSREADSERRLLESFRDLLGGGRIRTYFQPIYALPNLAIFGYEALSRGPAGTPFESPELLFTYATRTNVVWELEQLCLKTTARSSERLTPNAHLFVNVEPEVVHRLEPGSAGALEPLRHLPNPVVLEITERAAIHDYVLFRESLSKLKELGFKIAIDDAGSGYASLQSIAELRPDFLKISNYLVSSLDTNAIRRDVVEMLLKLANRLGATVIAEGIENESELERLLELNVPLGQGFYLGRPEPLA